MPNTSAAEAKIQMQKGDANAPDQVNAPYWDTYDTINQLYLEIGKTILKKIIFSTFYVIYTILLITNLYLIYNSYFINTIYLF